MRIIKFRQVTESQWLNLDVENRLPDTRYTIYSNDKSKILFEWFGRMIPIGLSEDEFEEKIKKITINGGELKNE